GDDVITTALTAPATAQAILQCGATPRFADVDRRTRCLDPAAVEAAITPRTAAIVPVHLFGMPCDMKALMAIAERHKL
ncbi:DegT/DnrJ/EryC1/StrS family aminotransferase, partial [Acinetobacter baumannii]